MSDRSKYEAVFKCGHCKKETPMTDEQVEATHKADTLMPLGGICSCGHHSYASSFRAKYLVDTSKWRFSHGKST